MDIRSLAAVDLVPQLHPTYRYQGVRLAIYIVASDRGDPRASGG